MNDQQPQRCGDVSAFLDVLAVPVPVPPINCQPPAGIPSVTVGPQCVGAVGSGGLCEAGAYGVAVAGLTSVRPSSPLSYAVCGGGGIAVTGDKGCASVQRYGVAVGGKDSKASAGAAGVARAVDGSEMLAGDGGIAFGSGTGGRASVGHWGVAYCHHLGKAAAGPGGVIVLGYHTAPDGFSLKVGRVEPEGPLKPGVFYKLDAKGDFVPA